MSVPRLFARLVDDAALFPPGNAPLPAGVRDHRAHERAWYAALVGPFLCPDVRLGDLAQALGPDDGADPLPVVVVVTTGPGGVAAAADAVRADTRLRLDGVEVPARAADAAAAVSAAAAAMASAGVPGSIEVRVGDEAALDALARAGVPAKLRTGGEQAAAFPSESDVAAFVLGCLHRGLPFKCTAGLHDAVRHTAADTGFEHHGFLNLLLAVRTALDGGAHGDVVAALARRDEAEIVHRLGHIDAVGAAAVRGWLRSYGSCSVTEPVGELVRLGLLTPPTDSAT